MSNEKHIISEKAAEAVDAAIAEALGDAYDCTRAWSAWGVGTMGPDDFYSVADDGDRVAEIRDAAIAALQPEFEAIKRQRDQLLSALKQVQVDVKNGNCVMADTAVFVDSAIAAVEQPKAAPATDADGWIEWNGGECPVPDEALVNVRSKNGLMNSYYQFLADDIDWSHGDCEGYDIIAYRVVQEGASS